jgi:hypothetical protein
MMFFVQQIPHKHSIISNHEFDENDQALSHYEELPIIPYYYYLMTAVVKISMAMKM